MTADTEKAEVLKYVFTLGFAGSHSSYTSQVSHVPKSQGRDWENEVSPGVSEDWIHDHQLMLNMHVFMGPDGMHPSIMRM